MVAGAELLVAVVLFALLTSVAVLSTFVVPGLFVVPLFTEGLATFEFVLVLDLVVVVLYEGLVVVLLLL